MIAEATVTATAIATVRTTMSTFAGCVTSCRYVFRVNSGTIRAVNSSIE